MSKYNLTDLLEEMRPKDQEFEDAKKKQGYLDAYGKKGEEDLKKMDKIRAMMKNANKMEEDAVEKLTAGLADEDGIKNNMKEDGVINITNPDEPKLTSMKSLITNAVAGAFPGAEMEDINDFYSQLMYNVKKGYVRLDGLDLADEFNQFAIDNNIPVVSSKDKPEAEPDDDLEEKIDAKELKEHFDRFK